MATKNLDEKLARILTDPSCKDFIIADAKDADMAAGLAAPGKSPEHHAQEGRFRTLDAYRQIIHENVAQGLVDIMLMSSSTNDILTIKDRLFDDSHVTPAIRANDTTDIWLAQGGAYPEQPSVPFRSATIDHAMCGKVQCNPEERKRGADLGLYSVTFNNDTELDARTLSAYSDFRSEAELKGFRHFLEVFDPNALQRPVEDLGRFINDSIVRTLAGVAGKERPIFLKIAYHGPAAMEAIASYDRSLIVGILGGSSGTTFDAFHQLWEARKYGARVALYGRMINHSEHQLSFIQHLRWIADGELNDPADAVRSYHNMLKKMNIQPYRKLEDDLQSSSRHSSYGKTSTNKGGLAQSQSNRQSEPQKNSQQINADFDQMSTEDKVKWNLDRWQKILG